PRAGPCERRRRRLETADRGRAPRSRVGRMIYRAPVTSPRSPSPDLADGAGRLTHTAKLRPQPLRLASLAPWARSSGRASHLVFGLPSWSVPLLGGTTPPGRRPPR